MWKSESPCSQSTGPQVYTLAVLLLLLRAPLTFYVVGTVRISWPRVSSAATQVHSGHNISIQYHQQTIIIFFRTHTHIHIFRDVNYWCSRQVGRYYIKAKRSLYYILDYAVARQSSTRAAAASPHHFYFNSEKVGYIVLLGSAAGFLPLEKLGH